MNYLNEIIKCINMGKINMDRDSVKHKQLLSLTKSKRRQGARHKLVSQGQSNVL